MLPHPTEPGNGGPELANKLRQQKREHSGLKHWSLLPRPYRVSPDPQTILGRVESSPARQKGDHTFAGTHKAKPDLELPSCPF